MLLSLLLPWVVASPVAWSLLCATVSAEVTIVLRGWLAGRQGAIGDDALPPRTPRPLPHALTHTALYS